MDERQVIHGRYFPHIDGIRTIAVIPVVLYHLLASLCPGGFVGVDIFFVISGYLITKGILSQLSKGAFTITAFYTRRVRRIIPAYVVLIGFVLLTSMRLYSNEMTMEVAGTAVASSLFSANVSFWLNSGGYFDTDAVLNPLLHLWSLGVEEHFYIFTPIILFLIYKWGKGSRWWMLGGLLCLTAGSLVWSIYAYYTAGWGQFNFYMLPTRAWELLVGSLLAYMAQVHSLREPGRGKACLGLVGMVLCLVVCYRYSHDTNFPGLTAIPPVLGAALMIRYGGAGLAGRILASTPFVWMGKISYSLYLWHWPWIVYWNYVTDNSVNPWGLGVVFGLSVSCAWLSWRFVEMPVRLAREWSFRRAIRWVWVGCGAVFLFSGALLAFPYYAKSLLATSVLLDQSFWRGTGATSFPDPKFEDVDSFGRPSFTILGEDKAPDYILWGDSHARAIAPGFDSFSRRISINGIFINRRMPLDFANSDSPPFDQNIRQCRAILAWVKQCPIKTVVLVNRWACRAEGFLVEKPDHHSQVFDEQCVLVPPLNALTRGLTEICTELKAAGKNVIIVTGSPEVGIHIPNQYERWVRLRDYVPVLAPQGVTYAAHKERQKNAEDLLDKLEQAGLARVLRIEDYFFSDKSPHATSRILVDEHTSVYLDDDHLSPIGAAEVLKSVEDELRGLIVR